MIFWLIIGALFCVFVACLIALWPTLRPHPNALDSTPSSPHYTDWKRQQDEIRGATRLPRK
jgi:hypothetical protein